MGLFSLLATQDNKRNVKKLEKRAEDIMALKPKYEVMSDSELQGQTEILKGRLKAGETLDDILNDAFAVTREASRRVLQMEHFKVQLMGGIALFQGRVAEMKTGEGKTLVETLPSYLIGLSGEGVHVVTVNDYLAKRDAEWMGKIYKFLGLSVGVIYPMMPDDERKQAYNADITYGTNNEFGFDYLRDNLKISMSAKVQRGHNFAIVDEVDSILIDEARTPLIISGASGKSSDLYVKANAFVRNLFKDDYEVDIKEKTVVLTESGSEKAERFFGVQDISDVAHRELLHHIQQALKANHIFKRDMDYIVEKGEVLIVDEFTGRILIGRRYSDGLHQAIEAKEGVKIREENKTHATITFQNYFRLYKKLSGMTGTAKTEEEEFKTIYNLDVVTIPTNKPTIRIDRDDVVYPTERGKIKAIVEQTRINYEKGQPTLIGTVTVEKSETLSSALKKAGIPHNVLNAKNHLREAEIVAQAGRFKSVTIATNMAGRGTDILLGGNPEFMAKSKLVQEGVDRERIDEALGFNELKDDELIAIKNKYDEYYKAAKKTTEEEKEKVLEAGGLFILGSERHESRRIDNQLRGRSGRQGDKGESVFFISLEDDLAKRFGGETLQRIYEKLKVEEDMPISAKVLSNRIEFAQKTIEGRNFAARKSVLEYDNVMNTQRSVMYAERDKVLKGEDVHGDIMKMIPDFVEDTLSEVVDRNGKELVDIAKANKKIEERLLPVGTEFMTEELAKKPYKEILSKLTEKTEEEYENKCRRYTDEGIPFAEVERVILLKTVDDKWIDQIDEMDTLRKGIVLRAYANTDPVVAYKNEAFDMFEDMTARIQEDTVAVLLKGEFKKTPKAEEKKTATPLGDEGRVPVRAKRQVGRNDPCPCGSGKKYKNCCGKDK